MAPTLADVRAKRARRTPDEARTLILKAAERVFAERLPAVVGLKDVAREAGVSHALVTHYFGTYENLVETTLERRFHALRDALMRELTATFESADDAGTMLAAYTDEVTVRLIVWAILSGRAGSADFFSHRVRGLALVADAIGTRARIPREDLEFLLVASFAITVVARFGGDAITGALGKRSRRELDALLEPRTTRMIEAFLGRIAQ
jgi:AcrR family transcriptional regulator